MSEQNTLPSTALKRYLDSEFDRMSNKKNPVETISFIQFTLSVMAVFLSTLGVLLSLDLFK